MVALLVTTDLMVSSMLEGAARGAGMDLVITAPAAASSMVGGGTAVVLLDLSAPLADVAKLVEDCRAAAPQASVVAFGPHVHREKLQQAVQAGCDEVLTRGELQRDAVSLLAAISASRS